MLRTVSLSVLALISLWSAATTAARAADIYAVEPSHTAVNFKVPHLGLSWTFGRFNDVTGTFTIDPAAPGKSAFSLAIKPESIDTGNAQRDTHLRSPDFFNTKQFPTITFVSTAAKPIKNGLEVTGNLTLHGVTKPVSFVLEGGSKAEFPPKVFRTGYSTELKLKRSDFGMDKMLEAIGDEIVVAVSFEGVQK